MHTMSTPGPANQKADRPKRAAGGTKNQMGLSDPFQISTAFLLFRFIRYSASSARWYSCSGVLQSEFTIAAPMLRVTRNRPSGRVSSSTASSSC